MEFEPTKTGKNLNMLARKSAMLRLWERSRRCSMKWDDRNGSGAA
jgi:hypothetical protein